MLWTSIDKKFGCFCFENLKTINRYYIRKTIPHDDSNLLKLINTINTMYVKVRIRNF